MAVLDLAGGLPRSVIDRLRPLLNGNQRVAVIAGAALAAAAVITAVLWHSGASYSVLFA